MSTHRNKNHCRSLSGREEKRVRKQNEKICQVTYFKENSWCIQPFESFCLVISQFVPASLQISALTGSAANLDLTSMSQKNLPLSLSAVAAVEEEEEFFFYYLVFLRHSHGCGGAWQQMKEKGSFNHRNIVGSLNLH